ncbi:MAG TPA: hypothetical protein VFD82_19675 [Planctomycetota bacterium]|nr:hypothetical protein [Planctomycetota bacterium]
MRSCPVALIVLAGALSSSAPAQDGASKAQERTIAELPRSLWFLLPPREAPPRSKELGLVVVLPGGTGSRDFLGFVEGGLLAQAPGDCVGALVTATKWTDDQQVVWPTAADKVPGMKYTTEEYVGAVVAAVEKEYAIDPARRVVVAWSSSGAAMHPLLASRASPFARAYVAMSIWPDLRDLTAVKGRRYVLDQSPEDQTTVFWHVRAAHAALTKAGAQVQVSTYAGGHGWQDTPLPRFRKGLEWLLSDEPAGKPDWPAPPVAKRDGKLVNLVTNGGFEDGTKGWTVAEGDPGVRVVTDEKAGSGSLYLTLGRGGIGVLEQHFELPPGKTLTATVRYRLKGVNAAGVHIRLYGADNKPIHSDASLVSESGDEKWRQARRQWSTKGAVRATVEVVLVNHGEMWLDEVVVTVDG